MYKCNFVKCVETRGATTKKCAVYVFYRYLFAIKRVDVICKTRRCKQFKKSRAHRRERTKPYVSEARGTTTKKCAVYTCFNLYEI